jgi:hypothetical protein
MSIDVEQLIVGLIFLVPGFISTSTQRLFQPRQFESAYQWTSSSLIRSIILNLLGVLAIGGLSGVGWIPAEIHSLTITHIKKSIIELPFVYLLMYVTVLYLFSAITGAISGIFPQLSIKALVHLLGLTSLGRSESVWRGIKVEERPENRQITWIKIYFHEGKTLLGRLKRASAIVEQDKPIEIYLKPAYEVHEDQLNQLTCMGRQADGVYARLQGSDVVEFYFTADEKLPVSWKTP